MSIELSQQRVIRSLSRQGFVVRNGLIQPPPLDDKESIRALHNKSVQSRVATSRAHLERIEPELLNFIANGTEVDPSQFRPYLVRVTRGSKAEMLFRYARLHWSIPISAGYGRRLRFLVLDRHNRKLVGLIGLGDPVMALKPRDNWIGWDSPTRRRRLRFVLDAFVLGAVPPYSCLLCGKLVAMLATSNSIRAAFRRQYVSGRSLISRRRPDARLALLTTTSALGRSSIYNRLKFHDSQLYTSVGYTQGSGDFHFANGLYQDILTVARNTGAPSAKHCRWGGGFRNRREVVKRCLRSLHLPSELLYHGIRREIFVIPLASNTREFLLGETDRLRYPRRSVADLASFFKERWLLPRASRDTRYQAFTRDSYRLWHP